MVLDITTAKVIDNKRTEIPRTKDIDELLTKEISATGQTQTVTSKPTPIPQPTTQPVQRVATKGYNFDLQECRVSGEILTCSLMITNSQIRDGELCLWGPSDAGFSSRMFDDSGNEYIKGQIQLGNKVESTDAVCNQLVVNVPIKANIRFDGVSSQVKNITLLEIGGMYRLGYDMDDFKIQFHNVPISN